MSRLEELEGKIKALSPRELQELRAWLAEYDAEVWDRQFHADALAGRLDAIADQVLKDFSEDQSTDLLSHRAAPSLCQVPNRIDGQVLLHLGTRRFSRFLAAAQESRLNIDLELHRTCRGINRSSCANSAA
jgi:hypothetical protein